MRALHLALALSLATWALETQANGAEPLAKAGSATESERKRLDGVYYVPDTTGSARILHIDGTSFRLTYDGPNYGASPAAISGQVYISGQTVAIFSYFNGEDTISLSYGFGVVDGELWLDVFTRLTADGGNSWIRTAKECRNHREDDAVRRDGRNLFARSRTSAPPSWILWRGDSWRMRPPGGKEESVGGVKVFSPSKAKPGAAEWEVPEGPFLPVFPPDKANESFHSVWTGVENFGVWWHGDHLEFTKDAGLTRFGVVAEAAWIGKAGAALAAGGEGPDQARPEDAFVRLMANPQSNSGLGCYRRRGDVIIAPWSIRLGPVGLIPKTLKPEEAAGAWVSESDSKTTVTISVPKQATPRISLLSSPDLSQNQYLPGPEGISHERIGYGCGMNHGDYPIHVYLVALADGRMARWISAGGCGNGPRPASFEFLVRAKREKGAAPFDPFGGGARTLLKSIGVNREPVTEEFRVGGINRLFVEVKSLNPDVPNLKVTFAQKSEQGWTLDRPSHDEVKDWLKRSEAK